MKKIEIVGKKFQRWTVLSRSRLNLGGDNWLYLCRCDCGVEREVLGYKLRRGNSTSCGCRGLEIWRSTQTTHGLSRHRLYQTWNLMMHRCYDSRDASYKNYGGRGITVCKRWHDVRNFISDLADTWRNGLTMDRINNNRHYEPTNVRWATKGEQSRNRRSCINLTWNGETKTVSEWARTLGISHQTLRSRIDRGFPMARVMRPQTTKTAISFRGNLYTLAELSRATGINHVTLRDRLALGWDVERVVTQPLRGRAGQ